MGTHQRLKEMPIMSLSLPESIATYFEISNGGDDTHLTDCFTQDARVFDEAETHQGHTAIQSWLRAARRKFEYRVTPISIDQQGNTVMVATTVTGNFPGSPVQLDQTFRLAGEQIQSLEIH